VREHPLAVAGPIERQEHVPPKAIAACSAAPKRIVPTIVACAYAVRSIE
jgi:hypothetical protein